VGEQYGMCCEGITALTYVCIPGSAFGEFFDRACKMKLH